MLTEWKEPDFDPEMISQYNIYRSTDMVDYKLYVTVPSYINHYVDNDVDIDNENYYYRIEAINTCLVQTEKSNPGSSILLEAGQEGNIYQLNWSPYEGWDTGVDHYIIEKLNENGQWEIIRKVNGNTTFLEDE